MSGTKKNVANEIVMIFRKLKWAVICGVVWFVVYSDYNELIYYKFSNEQIHISDAYSILGYDPREYSHYEYPEIEWKKMNELRGFPAGELVTRAYTETVEENESVRKTIVSTLFEKSFRSTLEIILIVFSIILLYTYTTRSFKWVQKYSD